MVAHLVVTEQRQSGREGGERDGWVGGEREVKVVLGEVKSGKLCICPPGIRSSC